MPPFFLCDVFTFDKWRIFCRASCLSNFENKDKIKKSTIKNFGIFEKR